MQKGLTILFLAFLAGICPAQNPPPPLPAWNDAAKEAWWNANPTPDKWPQAVDDLTSQLAVVYQQNRASAFSNADFQNWLEHLSWIRLGLDSGDLLANADNLKAFVALGKDETVSHLLVQKITPLDFRKESLQNLLKLEQANAADLHEYAALGVAFALVFDRPFPESWPHPQVRHQAVPIGNLDVVERFNFYVRSNRNHKLDEDPSQLTFEQLKHLVDSEVKITELEYAQMQRNISTSTFDRAFFSINYDHSRVGAGNFAFDWGQPTYTLADIERNGGICVDQAYYATILGKGRGIPTIYFQGQGVDGGHAWFGYLTRSGKWELDCGRYDGQNYVRGYTRDPQTWESIDDSSLADLFKNGEANPNYQPARVALEWAVVRGNDPSCRKILDDARSLMPELALAWRMEGAYLEHSGASDDDKKSFYQDWITQFQSFADMKIMGQRQLLAVFKKTNDPAADSLQQSIVLANRGSNIDVGIQGAWEGIQEKIKAGDWDGGRLEYEKSIRDFGDAGGGTLYYGLIEPYVEACLKGGHTDQARRGIRFTEDRMPMDPTSILANDFRDLKDKVNDAAKAASQ